MSGPFIRIRLLRAEELIGKDLLTLAIQVVDQATHDRYTAELFNCWTSEDKSELLWYLESHIHKDPFPERRVREARSRLLRLGHTLIRQLRLDEYFKVQPLQGAARRVVQIGIHGGDNTLQRLPWEVLESTELLKSYPGIDVRIMREIDIPVEKDSPAKKKTPACSSQQLNVLLVVARPLGRYDVEYRNTMLPLVEIFNELPPSAIRLDIVRPGTWSAFKNALKARGRGYYKIVHFDVHGKAASNGYVPIYPSYKIIKMLTVSQFLSVI